MASQRRRRADAGRLLAAVLLCAAVAAGAAQPTDAGAEAARPRGIGERATGWLLAHGLSREMTVVAISVLPVVELRGALPVGLFFLKPALPLWKVLVLSIVGNMLPILLVLLLLDRAVALLSRVPAFRRFFEWLFRRTRSKAAGIQKDEFWGLALFVGIPLPGTGAWSGALAAWLLGLPYWRAILSIFVGVLMAAVAVSIPCVLFQQNITLGLVITGAALTAVLVYLIVRAVRRARATPNG
ncbi:small multi-drug export protein [candidate division WOR-3 bacterium]|nr:small multi-drug export protein [candidate division WOR-3 bacterium]